jgi:hypothetical protein
MTTVIKACAYRWQHADCEGMYEGARQSRYCPTCKKRRVNERQNAYYHRNHDERLAYRRAYYQAHKERMKGHITAYRNRKGAEGKAKLEAFLREKGLPS